MPFAGADESTRRLFFVICTAQAAECWRRLILRYQTWPWKLAQTMDTRLPLKRRRQVEQEFLAARGCQLDHASARIRRYLSHSLQDDITCQKFQDLVLVLCTGKVSNMTVENGFARAASMRSYMRGQVQTSQTMASKHFLAEIKFLHRLNLQEQERIAAIKQEQQLASMMCSGNAQLHITDEDLEPLPLVPCTSFGNEIVPLQEEPLHHSEELPRRSRSGGTNSWTLFRKVSFSKSVRAPGESKAEFQRRCWSNARKEWAAVKRDCPQEVVTLSSQAKTINQRDQEDKSTSNHSSQLASQTAHPIPAAILDMEVNSAPGFVARNSSQWRQNQSEMVSDTAAFEPICVESQCPHICVHTMNQEGKRGFQLFRDALRAVVRGLSKSKIRGECVIRLWDPDLANASSSSTSRPKWEEIYYAAFAAFKPFELVLWKFVRSSSSADFEPCIKLWVLSSQSPCSYHWLYDCMSA